MKQLLKKSITIRSIYFLFTSIKDFLRFYVIQLGKAAIWFFHGYRSFKKLPANTSFERSHLYPCLWDHTATTALDPVYFFQDTWLAKHIFALKPETHYDVGSNAKTLGILSQFIPIVMVDIRPPELTLPGLSFVKGDITQLPFEDESIFSLSSICVVEHIGLGRYGDTLDQFGSERSIAELQRVLKQGGYLFFTIPVDATSKVLFNAHRTFTRDHILSLFEGFDLVEEQYQYGNYTYDTYDQEKKFGTGMYMFRKPLSIGV